MQESQGLSFFFDPKSVAVVGASEKPGSWGYRITEGFFALGYQGALYLVNPNTQEVLGLKTYPGLAEIPGDAELVIIAIAAERVWDALGACTGKGVRGIVIISAGFGEALGEEGKRQEEKMARFSKRTGIRILGPNVSGIYDLHRNFCAVGAAGEDPRNMKASSMSFICQGGYAVHNIASAGRPKGLGIGKFVHTGNEADLQCTDFLEVFGEDPETEVILTYIEGLKDPRRFLRAARRITPQKPIIVYKGGESVPGNRAAASHTGVLAGNADMYRALFKQAGCIMAPTFETMLELGHAFTFFPPLLGDKVGIITMGGSWGVMLTDHLSSTGFRVPEFSGSLQKRLRDFGVPYRASTRNPVDFGAAGAALKKRPKLSIIESLLSSSEIDALIVHGYGMKGMGPNSRPWFAERQQEEEEILRRSLEMMRVYNKPLLIGSHVSHFESATVQNLVQDEIPVFSRLQDMADCLWSLLLYYKRRSLLK